MYFAHVYDNKIAYIYQAIKKHVSTDIEITDDKILKQYWPITNTPTSLSDLEQENKLLKAQLQAQTERSDFIEDCIAEMAGVVYNTEETTT